MSLRDAIRKSRMRQQGNADDVRAYMGEMASLRIEELFTELLAELRSAGLEEFRRIAATVKNGEKGDRGDSIIGPAGRNGRDGVDGKDGRDGKSVKGKDGRDGKSIKGKDGKDGREIKTSELLKKINEATGGVKITSVAGLEEWLKNLQRAIREKTVQKGGSGGGGGGMGNWLHETFSVSSATTTVTTASRAAAGGTAHILRYNGQVMAYGSQYTVSGKVYTFTFTLDDSSTVEISYVRT